MALVTLALMLAACDREQKEEVKPEQVKPAVEPVAPSTPSEAPPK